MPMEAKGPPPAKALPTPPPSATRHITCHREVLAKPTQLKFPPEGSAPYVSASMPVASNMRAKLETPRESTRCEATLFQQKIEQMPMPPLGAASPDSKSCWPFGGKAKRRRREREERDLKERREQRRAEEKRNEERRAADAQRAQENASVLQALRELTVSVGLLDAEVQRVSRQVEEVVPSSADSEAQRAKAAFFADDEKKKQEEIELQLVETEKALGRVLDVYHPTLEHTVNVAVANVVKDVQQVATSVVDMQKALEAKQQILNRFMVVNQSDIVQTVQVAVSKAMQNVQKNITTQLKETTKDMAPPPVPAPEVKIKFERAIQTEPEIEATPRKPPTASVIKVCKGSSTPTFSRTGSTPSRDSTPTPRGNAPRVMAFQTCDCGYKGAEDRVKITGPHHNKHCSSYRVDLYNNENEFVGSVKALSEPPMSTVAPTPTKGYTEEESVESALLDPACSASLIMIPDLQQMRGADETSMQSPNRGPFAPNKNGGSQTPTPIRYNANGEKEAPRNKPQCIVPVPLRPSSDHKRGSTPGSASRVPFGVVSNNNVEDDVTVRRHTSNFPNANRPLEFAM